MSYAKNTSSYKYHRIGSGILSLNAVWNEKIFQKMLHIFVLFCTYYELLFSLYIFRKIISKHDFLIKFEVSTVSPTGFYSDTGRLDKIVLCLPSLSKHRIYFTLPTKILGLYLPLNNLFLKCICTIKNSGRYPKIQTHPLKDVFIYNKNIIFITFMSFTY